MISKKEDLCDFVDKEIFKEELDNFVLSPTNNGDFLTDLFGDNNELLINYMHSDFEISEFLLNIGKDPFLESDDFEVAVHKVKDPGLLERYLAISAVPYTIVVAVYDEDGSYKVVKIAYGSYDDCDKFVEKFDSKREHCLMALIGTPEDLEDRFPLCVWIATFWQEPVNYDLYHKYVKNDCLFTEPRSMIG